MTNIVTVNVSQQVAPTPSNLQRSGALISEGGTNTAPGTLSLLTQLADLTPLLSGAHYISSITQSAGTATVTIGSGHGYSTGDVIQFTIAGAVQTNYNGAFLCTITSATTFTYTVPSGTASPATTLSLLVYTSFDVSELLSMATTFFTQGTQVPVYVLELGPVGTMDGPTTLNNWIIANPNTIYSFLLPREWDDPFPGDDGIDGNIVFLSMLPSYSSPTSKTYFFVTSTLQTYWQYSPLWKDVLTFIETPVFAGVPGFLGLSGATYTSGTSTWTATSFIPHGILPGQWFQLAGMVINGVSNEPVNGWVQAYTGTTGSTLTWRRLYGGTASSSGYVLSNFNASTAKPATEFSAAAAFWQSLQYNPSSVNKVTPYNLSFLYGVTPFPTKGLSALLQTLQTANINIIGTGAAGGISNALLQGGNTMDGNTFNYWYATDWAQINVALSVTNAVINGSNNPANPLYLNQAGIDALEGIATNVMRSGVTFGLFLGAVNETEFDGPGLSYVLAQGTYAGNVLVNAVPFAPYYAASPGDYAIGKYAGFTIIFTPQRGFAQIVFDLIVTNFVSQ